MGCYIHLRVKFPDMSAIECVVSKSEVPFHFLAMETDTTLEETGLTAIGTVSDPDFQVLLPAFDRNMLNLYLTEYERNEEWARSRHANHKPHDGVVLTAKHYWHFPLASTTK